MNHIWKFSCIYPEPSNTDGALFVQWNHIEVFSDRHLIMKQKHQASASEFIVKRIDYFKLSIPSLSFYWWWIGISNAFLRSINFRLFIIWYWQWSLCTTYWFSTDTQLSSKEDVIFIGRSWWYDYLCFNSAWRIFRFLSPDEYSNLVELKIRPESDRIIRAFLLYWLKIMINKYDYEQWNNWKMNWKQLLVP